MFGLSDGNYDLLLVSFLCPQPITQPMSLSYGLTNPVLNVGQPTVFPALNFVSSAPLPTVGLLSTGMVAENPWKVVYAAYCSYTVSTEIQHSFNKIKVATFDNIL